MLLAGNKQGGPGGREVLILDNPKASQAALKPHQATGFKSHIFTGEKLFIYIFGQETGSCAPQLAVPTAQHCPAPDNQAW